MPIRSDVKKVMVIGSGPIIISQAAEFDYSGSQACKALREEGIFVVLVNSNPATIMTDEATADRVYIEPLNVDVLEKIISRERPDGILPTLGGQTGLNLAVELASAGIVDKYGVKLLGTSLESIKQAEDRLLFKQLLQEIGEPVIESMTVHSVQEAIAFANQIGYPLISRPAYTLGGTGGGIAHNQGELTKLIEHSLRASPIGQTLLERSIEGWKEIEYEVIRDSADNAIIVCNMENIDPVGVHTGDSIVVAPSQTLTDHQYQILRDSALRIVRALKIEGGCNVQFALDPKSDDYYVIEVNPRVSRSSALASKATGYPIARVAAKIALGLTLDEIPNAVTSSATAALEPSLDYCVVKIPRWPFDKFTEGDRRIGTQMKATGEVMAIDRCFEAALQKAVRSLEISGRNLLWESPKWNDSEELDRALRVPTDERLWAITTALRRGYTVEDVSKKTKIDPWFIKCIENIVSLEGVIRSSELDKALLWRAKRLGFSDAYIAQIKGVSPEDIRKLRKQWGITPVWKMVDTCAAEFEATTPYFYSTYEEENEALPQEGRSSVVIGSGPIRIGQGIEFDYCSVHSARALREAGVKSIMINSNPETVSTDFDTSDRLYFDPLDDESIRDIVENERLETLAEGYPTQSTLEGDELPVAGPPVIVQFGGQTAINLASKLHRAGFKVLGSSLESIDLAEDRERFDGLLNSLGLLRPPGGTARDLDSALETATRIGYPLLVRPSYVLGGQAMRIVYNEVELLDYIDAATEVSGDHPVLLDRYIEGTEVEVDAVSDGETVVIPGIVEHIERAGVHSGDSFGVYPQITLDDRDVSQIEEITVKLARAMNVKGLMNVQFVVQDHQVYILEVNPRASRTVPFISKVTGVPLVTLATHVMLGSKLANMGYATGLVPRVPLYAVKAPVFSMSKLAGVDTVLGPEMKSTGEVMGVDVEYEPALMKAMIAAGINPPPGGSVLMSIADHEKPEALPLAAALVDMGYALVCTEGTSTFFEDNGIRVNQVVHKIGSVRPDITDIIRRRQVSLVINTPSRSGRTIRDGFEIRRAAAESGIPCLTSLDTAKSLVKALQRRGDYNIATVMEYRQGAVDLLAV